MARPPKYVHGFIDGRGKPRFYLRRAGFKQVPLPGLPWSPNFMARYQELMATEKALGMQIAADRVVPRSVRAPAIRSYGGSSTPLRANHLTFLVTDFGAPFAAAGFGNWFRDRCNEAGLKHCYFTDCARRLQPG